MKLKRLVCIALLAVGVLVAPTGPAAAVGETTFTNPLLANGADPWLSYWNGNYYLATTTWNSQLVMRKSPMLSGLGTAAAVHVWSDTDADRCCNFWAPEFHRLTGPSGTRWYLMYTAGQNGTLDHQRLRVLESAGDNPMGPYRFMGTPMPSTWNIDGTYLQHNGQLYLLYSQWVGQDQSLLIAQMSNPWTVTGSHVVISTPTHSWEIEGGRTNEAPVVLTHDGQTFVVYSASSCNTPNYKLGRLTLTGTNPLSAASWSKLSTPVFQTANGVYGPGHNGFSNPRTAHRTGSSTTATPTAATGAAAPAPHGRSSSPGTPTAHQTWAARSRPAPASPSRPASRGRPPPPRMARPTRWPTATADSAWRWRPVPPRMAPTCTRTAAPRPPPAGCSIRPPTATTGW